MPARRRKSSPKMTAVAASAAEEPRPTITQVVEVVEEDIPIAEPPPEPESVKTDEPESVMPVAEESPTRKSMVEELYTSPRQSVGTPEISMHRNGSKKPIMVWAIVTIVVAILTGSILFAVTRKGSMPSILARPTPTPTLAPTATPTPTPATVDKSSFEIQVLNGGGTPGAASKMKTFLEGKGYKVASTGNTPDYTFDTTEIHGKSNMTDAVANLKADLKDSYTLGTVDTDLDASASADVQVIVGKQ